MCGIWIKVFGSSSCVVLVIHTHSKYEQIAQIWDVLDLSVPGIQLSSLGVVAVCNSLGLDATANSRTELLHFGGGGNGGGLLGDKKSHTFTLDETH